jgi:hypothetical protein
LENSYLNSSHAKFVELLLATTRCATKFRNSASTYYGYGIPGKIDSIQIKGFKGALLAILPSGAFLGLGSIIALKNVIDHWQQKQAAKEPVVEAAQQESPG